MALTLYRKEINSTDRLYIQCEGGRVYIATPYTALCIPEAMYPEFRMLSPRLIPLADGKKAESTDAKKPCEIVPHGMDIKHLAEVDFSTEVYDTKFKYEAYRSGKSFDIKILKDVNGSTIWAVNPVYVNIGKQIMAEFRRMSTLYSNGANGFSPLMLKGEDIQFLFFPVDPDGLTDAIRQLAE